MEITKLKRRPNQLKKYRKERGLNQSEVAKIVGVKDASVVSRWEKGSCLPNTIVMFKLAILYRTMIDNLFYGVRMVLIDEIGKKEDKVLGKNRRR